MHMCSQQNVFCDISLLNSKRGFLFRIFKCVPWDACLEFVNVWVQKKGLKKMFTLGWVPGRTGRQSVEEYLVRTSQKSVP